MANPQGDEDQWISDQQFMGGAGVLGGGALAAGSKNAILGRKTVYHGTSKDRAKSIRENGLSPQFAGTGASFDLKNEHEMNLSKGNVFVTSSKGVGMAHANITGLPIEEVGAMQRNPESASKLLNPKGDVLKANMDYQKWHGMKADSEIVDQAAGNIGGFIPVPEGMVLGEPTNTKERMFNRVNKEFASKGPVTVEPHEFLNNGFGNTIERYKQTAKNLPSYIKNHPIRFGGGLATAAGGGAIAYAGAKNLMPQEKEANVMEYGLLKLAGDYERSVQVRGALHEQGRPLDAKRYGDYIDEETQEGAMAGGLLGAAAGGAGGLIGSDMLHNRKVKNLEQQGIQNEAEGLLAKANLERSYEGALTGQNDWGQYNANYDRHNELESAMKNNAKELEALKMRGVTGQQAMEGLKHGEGDNLLHFLQRYRPGIKGAALGGVIGAGTLGAAAGAIATRDGAPEMGMENHEVVKDVAPLGETAGTLAGGVAGAIAGSHIPSRYNIPFGSLLGASAGMYGGRQAGKAIQNHMRDEE